MDWSSLLNDDRPRPTTGTDPDDPRSEFDRDFDRAVFSTPVKRLQDKAQVFPLEPHDAVRTRLTHSLEVSSVARGLAARTTKWMMEECKISGDMDRRIQAIAATCGLIHDLGNPPFGHAGETAISAWFHRTERPNLLSSLNDQQTQDFKRFDGNAQSLRLVAKLQILADDSGLNLTYGTLSALMKYVASSNQADENATDQALRKPGYFASENDLVKDIWKITGTDRARHPIAFLVEAADDIAYLPADVEDAVKKGVLSWKQVEELLQPQAPSVKAALKSQDRILKAGRSSVPADLEDDILASAFRTAAISVMVRAASNVFRARYSEIIEGRYRLALFDDPDFDAKDLASRLRSICTDHVYRTRTTLLLEVMGRQVIGDLMEIFWEGAQNMPPTRDPTTSTFAGKINTLVSRNYRHVLQDSLTRMNLPEEYHRIQLVTDYICGMTDSFARNLHADLFNGR